MFETCLISAVYQRPQIYPQDGCLWQEVPARPHVPDDPQINATFLFPIGLRSCIGHYSPTFPGACW